MRNECEQKAIAVGNDPKLLRERLMYTHDCLRREWKSMFSKKRMDFTNKRMLSDDGRWAIQWQVRPYPELPESYENQQTNWGETKLIKIHS